MGLLCKMAHQGAGKGKRISAGNSEQQALKRQRSEDPPQRTEEVELSGEGGNGRSVTLPLDVHTSVECRLRRGEGGKDTFWPATIIERTQGSSDDPREWEYYVHYHNLNRRMDTWITVEDMRLETAEREWERKALKQEDDGGRENQHFERDALREHEECTKVRNILNIELGPHVIDTWYFSPFPEEVSGCNKIYMCEFTLRFFKRKSQLRRHMRKVKSRHPPGDEIYRDGSIAVFEIDGRKHREYCQNLCYLSKLFLDHKSLFYDTDLFLFYVSCEVDERGYHITGYFSKEKFSEEGYNLACILTLPPYQRKGYGKFLISFSYELSKKERKVGTPERPLSDLGLVSYRSYWTRVILSLIKEWEGAISINEIRDATMIKTEDIVSTLQYLKMLACHKGSYIIYAPDELVDEHFRKAGSPGKPVHSEKLIWTPWSGDRDLVRT